MERGEEHWLERARSLRASRDWETLLELAERGWGERVHVVRLYLYAAEAALELRRPALALRWVTRAQGGTGSELAPELANLTGLALLQVGNRAKALSYFHRALGGARRRGDEGLAAQAARSLAEVAAAQANLREHRLSDR